MKTPQKDNVHSVAEAEHSELISSKLSTAMANQRRIEKTGIFIPVSYDGMKYQIFMKKGDDPQIAENRFINKLKNRIQ